MANDDFYLQDAVKCAQQLMKINPRFELRENQKLNQGKNNRVLHAYYDNKPVILKFYGDEGGKHIGSVSERKGRELFFLQSFAESGVIPKVHYHGDDFIVMNQLPGISLSESLSELSQKVKDQVSYKIGFTHAQILKIPISEEAIQQFEQNFFERRRFREIGFELIDRGYHRLKTDPEFSGDDLKTSIDMLQSWFNQTSFDDSKSLHKQDWNPGNTLIQKPEHISFIDWEQCFSGPMTAYLGAVLDCLNSSVQKGLLSWLPLKRGYEESSGNNLSNDDLESIYVMAHLNAWRVLIGCNPRMLSQARHRLLPRDYPL